IHQAGADRLCYEYKIFVHGGGLDFEALHHMLLALAVDVYRTHHSFRMKFFDQHRAFMLVPVREIIAGNAIRSVPHKGDDLVVAIELSEVVTPAVLVKPARRIVVPEVQLAERGRSGPEKLNPAHGVLGDGVPTTTAAFDLQFGKVEFKHLFSRGTRLRQFDHHRLRLTVRISRDVMDL